MTIKVGDRLPEATFTTMGADGPKTMSTADVFANKKVALFAVPAPYSPTCHKQHLPGFVASAADLKKKGIDTVACTAVSDVWVMTQWAKDSGADGKVLMLADGNGEFAKKIELENDMSARGMGTRSKRYSMIVDNGVVKVLNVEEAPPKHEKSSATALLACSF